MLEIQEVIPRIAKEDLPVSTNFTIPWHDDEKITINGKSFVYTLHRGELTDPLVRFVGGWASRVSTLITAGHSVVMPRNLRYEVTQ